MPIGAVVGSAVVGAGASVVSGSMAAKSQKKAAQSAADTSLQVADKNNAFAQDIYNQNAARLDPTAVRGNTAGDAIMELLLGPAPAGSGSTGGGTTGGGSAGSGSTGGVQHAPVVSQTPVVSNSALQPTPEHGGGLMDRVRTGGDGPGVGQGRTDLALPTMGPGAPGSALSGASGGGVIRLPNGSTATPHTPTPTPSSSPAAGGGGTGGTGSALDAFDLFRNSTNYQFRLNQGLDAVGTKFAAAGAFESGAEKKGINDYAQNFASNELANYMDRLYQQEALGVTAASSLAGVGTNLVSQVSANNRAAGDAAANAALVAGQASANNYANIGSAIAGAAGTIGGALGSSYHPASTNPGNIVFTGGPSYRGSGYAI